MKFSDIYDKSHTSIRGKNYGTQISCKRNIYTTNLDTLITFPHMTVKKHVICGCVHVRLSMCVQHYFSLKRFRI